MAFSRSIRVQKAKAQRTNTRNMCLRTVRIWCGVPARYPSARLAGLAVPRSARITGRKAVPTGNPIFMKKRWGDIFGHIVLVVGHDHDGEPLVRSTDYPSAKVTSTVRLDTLEQRWGYKMTWGSKILNGVRLPQ